MSRWVSLAAELGSVVGSDKVQSDLSLGPLTTYRVGGPAALHVRLEAPELVPQVAAVIAAAGVPVLVVGKGSNLLVADAGFNGVALTLGEGFAFCDIETTRVRAGGAASLPVVARQTVAASLTGFEWAVGVPGSIGGAVRMNAGGHGSDMAAVVDSVELCDLGSGCVREVAASDLEFGYRTSAVRDTDLVLAASLRLASGDRAAGEAELSEIVKWRRENQPGGQNAGSVFTNPVGDSAGRLVEAAGCKGLRLGSAMVSDKHANFIQADAGGSADDVRELMVVVAARVRQESGVTLLSETRLVGFETAEQITEGTVEQGEDQT